MLKIQNTYAKQFPLLQFVHRCHRSSKSNEQSAINRKFSSSCVCSEGFEAECIVNLGPVYMRPGPCQTGMKIDIVSMFT